MSVIGGMNTMSRLFSSARGDAYMNTLSGARRPTDDELARQAKGDAAIQANLKDLFREPWTPVDAEVLSPTTVPESEALAAAESSAAVAEASGAAPYDPSIDRPHRRVELNLESIEDPMIRAMFDPARTDAEGSMHAIDRFTPAQLDEMVRLMKPEYLMVLRQKNLAAGDVQAAGKLSFHNISYKHEGRQILTNCSGFVDTGELVGMCGGPDSGVSALLELLSGSIGSRELWHRQEKFSPAGPGSKHPRDAVHASHLEKLESYIDGYVLYDGKKPSRAFHSIVGFAPKSDVHLPYLTVYETLYFSARLRLPKCLSDANVRLRVLIILKVLGLSHVKDTIVGDASIRGVSGGEKRRVGFGVELVAGHSILLADLPTNGLDSASALGLIQSMSYACAGGFSLLFSIVQASQEILGLMDRIILMSKGHIIYTGPPSRAQEFLASQGFRKPPQKALPQFLEELSANPEKFWMPFLTTRISDAELNAGHLLASVDVEAQKKQYSEEHVPGFDRQSSAVHFQSPLSRTYDFRNSKTPRQQAFECVYHAWLQTPAYEAMKQVLDNAHARPAELGYRSEQRRIMRRISSVFYGKRTALDRIGDGKQQQVEMADLSRPAPPALKQVSPPANQTFVPASSITTDNEREVSASKVIWHVDEGDEEESQAAVVPYNLNGSSHSNGANGTNGTNGTSITKSASPEVPIGRPVERAVDLSTTGNILQRRWYSKYQSSIWQQFASNMDRQIKATLRNTGLWRDVWLLAIIIGVIIGLLFYQLGQDENGIRQRVSLFFFLLTYVAFNAVQLVPVLAQQRPIFYVQSLHSDWYSSFTYFVPLMLVQLPIVCVEAFLLLLPVYGISDLTGTVVGGGRFWTAYLILLMNSYIARTFMLLLYVVSPNESIADVFNQVTGILFSKLCGFFIPAGSIVRGWKWVFYISWFTYALRAMSINDVASIVHACAPSPIVECRAQTGSDLLILLYDMDVDVNNLWGNVWTDVLSLLYFFLAFGFASAVLLAYVDWSEIDHPEAPDFGIANDQIADAQAWQEDEAQNEKAALAEQASAVAVTDGKPRHSLSRRPSLSLVRRPSIPATPINSPAASSSVQAAGSVAASPMASPRKAGGVLATLSRVLGHYTSGSRRRPVRSHIVLPVEDNDAGNEPEPLELGESAALAAALNKAGVADDNARSEPSLEVLNQRSLTIPSSRSRAPANLDVDAALNDGNSLTRTQQLHYQHEVHLLDIGKLLKAGRTPTTPAGSVAQQQKRLTSKPSSAGSAAAVAAAKESAPAGAIIEWSNLSYSVDVVDENGKPYKRQLLSNCYGVCMPGTMVALMGASGAGKSTLLDVLANKKTGGYVTGSILLDGKPRDETFPHVTAYVEQWDSHSPYATVREALEFSARLRLAHDLNDEEIAARVDATLQILGIKHLEHEQLGGAEGIAGVSQEVRKKTTIGVELVSQPRLLFLDEPTTGLDAAGAFSVCQAIKNLSKHIAVMCTIHQPSQELIAMFDSLLLMQPGGKVSYCSSVSDIPRYFAEHDLGVIAKDRNVSDFALESIRTVTQANAVMQGAAKDKGTEKKEEDAKPTADKQSSSAPATAATSSEVAAGSNFAITVEEVEEKESLVSPKDPSVPKSFTGPGSNVPNAPPDNGKFIVGSVTPAASGSVPSGPNTSRIRDLPAEFLSSPEGQSITARLHKGIYASTHPEDAEAAKFAAAATKSAGVPTSVPPAAEPLRPFLTQLRCLFARDSFTILRNHRDLFIRFFLTLFMAFVVGTVFFRLDYTQVDAEERLSALFVCLLFIMFTANAFLPELFFARPMLFRERTSGSYAALPFFVSRMLAQLPWILLENLPLAIMLVFISNLNQEHGNHPLALVYLCFVVVRYASLTATYFIGAMLGQPNNANTIQATYFNLLFVFTGFLIHYDSIPIGWKWFADINYLRWAFDFLAANEARNMAFTCAATDYILAEPSSFIGLCPADLVTTVGASPSLLPPGAVGYTSDTLLKCPYACGGDLLRQWGVDYSDGDMARNLGIVACFGMAFGIAAFLAIKFIQHIKR